MIPARLLKECAEDLAPILPIIFDNFLQTGTVPDDWKTANVVAIFKKGQRYDPANYRPASLNCLCCKMLEYIIVSNVMKHVDAKEIPADCQHGFRASCKTQLVTQVLHDLASALDKVTKVNMIVLDFSKAFDCVTHDRRLGKLHHYGIEGTTVYHWIASILLNRTQRVVVEGYA